jgi:integrase
MEAAISTIGRRGQRIYRITYQSWREWCLRSPSNPLDLRAENIKRYLIAQEVSYNTRHRHLSALRKLARVIAKANPNNAALQESLAQLDLLRVPQDRLVPSERNLHELVPGQADKALAAWSDATPLHIRNRALVALLFMTGMSRSEVCSIRRANVDLAAGTIHIVHDEKTEKSHTVAIPGDLAIQALRNWMALLPPERQYVFPSIRKSGSLGPDKPTVDLTVYRIIQQTQERCGLVFTPQDVRRTFLVEALDNGSPLADVQAQVGHRDPYSTLRYAKTTDAAARRKRLKLRYGSKS